MTIYLYSSLVQVQNEQGSNGMYRQRVTEKRTNQANINLFSLLSQK